MKSFLYRTTLPAVVFLTGAAVLIVEVVATRILSPYFGNTLYTVSSVLGVVLAALSVGYFLGGRLADRRPSEAVFYGIILLGGASVLLLQLLSMTVLPTLGYALSILSGPLITSLLLFFLPGFLLGILSPFAIKMQEQRLARTGIGTITGEMFFYSTLGSIAGSLAAGFVLVPFFGIDSTIIGVGVFLAALGAAALFRQAVPQRLLRQILPLTLGLLLTVVCLLLLRQSTAVYSDDGVYEKLTIFDSTYKGQPTRFFMQDRSSSSAMFLNSDELVFDYTKYYELYRVVKPEARRSLVIGGAAYSIPKALLADSPEMQVDVAEIEPSLEALGKKYFRVPENPRLKTHIIDGRRLLSTNENHYDLIFSDVYYSLYSIPAHFTTKEFFETAKRRLAPNGLFIANLIGSFSPGQPSFTFSELKTFQSVFANSAVFAVQSPESKAVQNIIIVGINGNKKLNLDAATYAKSQEQELRGLANHRVDTAAFDLSPYPILTDNYAPVEYLISRMLKDSAD